MDTKKWLYFATQADEADLNGIDDVVCLPAASLVSISPTANNRVTMYFKSVKSNAPNAEYDSVVLETVVWDAFEVANEMIRHINAHPHHDGFITVANDVTTTDHADSALADLVVPGQYMHKSITGVNSINISADADGKYDYHAGLNVGSAATVVPSPGALEVNTFYTANQSAAKAWTIPSAAAGRAGDWITVLYTTAVGNGNAHTYTTTTDTSFANGSNVIIPSGSSTSRVTVCNTSNGSSDNIFTITGLTNGDGGVGSTLHFRNTTGKANGWALSAVVLGQGQTSAASADTDFS